MRDQENYTRPFSNYIDVVPYKEDLALYNKINGSLVLLAPNNIILDKNRWLCTATDKATLDFLEEHLFFVSDEYVQNIIREKSRLVEDYNNVSLVISTTELCNCKCAYCYQNHWEQFNSLPETDYMHWILEYIRLIVQRSDGNGTITVKYFGGEPLIKADFILRLNREIYRIIQSSNKNIDLHYELDSNCTLLTREFLQQFDNLSIATTLTMPHDHNTMRSNSFNQVLQRLIEVTDLLHLPQYQLNLGYNAHHRNIDEFEKFLQLIEEVKIPCQIYVVNVVNYENTDFVNMLSDEDFEKRYRAEIIPKLIEHGYHADILPPFGLHRKCEGTNIVNRKFFSNGTQAMCSYFHKKNDVGPTDFPMPILPSAFLEPLPNTCVQCYDYPYCGGKRPCLSCNGHFEQSEAMRERIRLYLDMQADL